MRFGTWSSIDNAAAAAPAQPGVLQTRAETLIEYPRGRSAMVLYAASRADETLQSFVAAGGAPELQRSQAAGASLVRYGESAAPLASLAKLLHDFTERFGAAPVGNR